MNDQQIKSVKSLIEMYLNAIYEKKIGTKEVSDPIFLILNTPAQKRPASLAK